MDCKDRIIGCHTTCEAYLEEVAKNKIISEKRKKEENTIKALKHLDRPKVSRRSNNTPQRCHLK
jgi:hypothetical protein